MAQLMDALVKPVAGPGLELRQVPIPEPGPGEVLIKIHKTAICGTDVHIYNWDPWAQEHIKPPMVIGHLRPLPQLPHRQHPVVQGYQGRRRGSGRRLRGICLHPREQRDHH